MFSCPRPSPAACPDPGVALLLRGEPDDLMPQRRERAIRDVCRRLGVHPREVDVTVSVDPGGTRRIVATWTPT